MSDYIEIEDGVYFAQLSPTPHGWRATYGVREDKFNNLYDELWSWRPSYDRLVRKARRRLAKWVEGDRRAAERLEQVRRG